MANRSSQEPAQLEQVLLVYPNRAAGSCQLNHFEPALSDCRIDNLPTDTEERRGFANREDILLEQSLFRRRAFRLY